jgi:hypothetical protein
MDTGLSFWYTALEPTLQREKHNRRRMKLETLKGSLLIFNLQSAPDPDPDWQILILCHAREAVCFRIDIGDEKGSLLWHRDKRATKTAEVLRLNG